METKAKPVTEKLGNPTLQRLEAVAEKITGQSAAALRNQTLSELRQRTEGRVRHKLYFCSKFPLIGRGSVMRDRIIDHETIEGFLGRILH